MIFATPSLHLRSVVARVAPHIAPTADVLSVVKGLEAGTLLRMSEVIAQAGGIEPSRVAALSGPNLAAEIARGLPASAVVARRRSGAWRAASPNGSAAASSACTSIATSSGSSCAGR